MNRFYRAAAFVAFTVGALAAGTDNLGAQTTTLTFEGVSPTYPFSELIGVQEFYNGGTSEGGTSGANYGVSFSNNAAATCLNTLGTFCSLGSRGGQGDPASAFTAMFIFEGDATIMNRAAGMVNQISFNYVASFSGGTFWVWDGLNGTGNMIGSVSLPENAGFSCIDDYLAFFCPFGPMTVEFSGVARSAVFTGVEGLTAIDDITFQAFVIPEPSTVALLALGLGVVGFAARRRRV